MQWPNTRSLSPCLFTAGCLGGARVVTTARGPQQRHKALPGGSGGAVPARSGRASPGPSRHGIRRCAGAAPASRPPTSCRRCRRLGNGYGCTPAPAGGQPAWRPAVGGSGGSRQRPWWCDQEAVLPAVRVGARCIPAQSFAPSAPPLNTPRAAPECHHPPERSRQGLWVSLELQLPIYFGSGARCAAGTCALPLHLAHLRPCCVHACRYFYADVYLGGCVEVSGWQAAAGQPLQCVG